MFLWNRKTKILTEIATVPIQNIIEILKRDQEKVLRSTANGQGNIYLVMGENMESEQYIIEIESQRIEIKASDELGFIYGLLYLSEHFLGIKPFWLWMNQEIDVKDSIEIEEGIIRSVKPVVCFRGWFFNDEVLMLKWKYNENGIDGWKMCFEALLRCGGNMVIPGTDKMSRRNRRLAADMGLWITHHHAEPLGAEMFVREYPDEEPNYMEHPEAFHKLWEDAVREQKEIATESLQGQCKVVWNLCFRGQGDMPFWSTDTTGQFDTPRKRGKMISDMIRKQCEIVRKYVKNPIFCTNLYGEIMELYEQGYIELDSNVIKVRADNGYGRMVTRRRDNHTARVSSMPDEKDSGMQGIYYHVSFYDLQAANHITMLPNSINFLNRELDNVLKCGGNDFWIINCSNVRPHTYYLDAVRRKWFGCSLSDEQQSKSFTEEYFHGMSTVADCYAAYPKAMISYGINEDEHAGEQFYTENIRLLAHQLIVDQTQSVGELYWLTGKKTLAEQIKYVSEICEAGINKLEALLSMCKRVEDGMKTDCEERILFHTTISLQAYIHVYCAKGVVLFGNAYAKLQKKDYPKAFTLLGQCVESFDRVNEKMRAAEYGIWKDFYLNDCFADVKHTAYMVRKVMGMVRELGDNARHDKWYREYCYSKEDRKVFLLLVTDNHMTDWELYEAMKTSQNLKRI